jgi:hypothetical protein
MKRSPRHIASFHKATAVLDVTALASARGGLVSNFNFLAPSNDNPDVGPTPNVMMTNGGPTGMW